MLPLHHRCGRVIIYRDRRDRIVVGFTNIFTISDDHHQRCEFESRSLEVSSVQPYVTNFVSDLRHVGGFLQVRRFPTPIKLAANI